MLPQSGIKDTTGDVRRDCPFVRKEQTGKERTDDERLDGECAVREAANEEGASGSVILV